MKKIISILLASVLSLALLAGCGSKQPASSPASSGAPKTGPFKIAVAFGAISTTETAMQDYLQKYVGPAFNCSFIFSEAINSADKALAFVENAGASGAKALISFYTDAPQEQMFLKANEMGMYCVSNAQTPPQSWQNQKYILGTIGSNNKLVGEAFASISKPLLNDGQKHNVVIVSGGASGASLQHQQSTIALLEMLQNMYSLKYDKDITTIAKSTAVTNVNTGTDMKIAIYPGFANQQNYVQGFSSLLQTGEYDTVICVYAGYTNLTAAIDQVEKTYKKNIRLAVLGMPGPDLDTFFKTKDSTGDTVINSAIVKPANSVAGALFAEVYNALTGNPDLGKTADGKIQQLLFPMWTISGAAEYAKIATIDTSEKTYGLTIDDLKKMIKVYTPSLTNEQFAKLVLENTAQDIMKRRGM